MFEAKTSAKELQPVAFLSIIMLSRTESSGGPFGQPSTVDKARQLVRAALVLICRSPPKSTAGTLSIRGAPNARESY